MSKTSNAKRSAARAAQRSAKIEGEIDFYARAVEFAIGLQQDAADALVACGSVDKAAASLGWEPEQLRRTLTELKRRAGRRGYAPAEDQTHPAPAGQHVKGVSTYYGADGSIIGQWVKTRADEQHRFEALLDAMQAALEGYDPKIPRIKPPKHAESDLMCVYPMGDPHFGLYAWAAETGEDFDLNTASTNLYAAVDHLVGLAPPAALGLIINLGDFFHADNKDARTARSGNILDTDTRWGKVLEVGVDAMIRAVHRALERHGQVKVINAIGNHDDHSATMLSLCLRQCFRNNPRVEIDPSPAAFHYHRFGSALIGVHHGHGAKPGDLPGIMSVDRAADWGETTYRHWYTGHIHHDSVRDHYGATVESFRTLAARDAWHAGQGYRSERDMKCDVWHRSRGRIARNIVSVRWLGGSDD